VSISTVISMAKFNGNGNFKNQFKISKSFKRKISKTNIKNAVLEI
jgi:hypothetical protein